MAYVPSPREQAVARRVLREQTPSPRVHGEYLTRAAFWLDLTTLAPQFVSVEGEAAQVQSSRLLRSELFNRDYLVVFVDPEWLHRIAPTCDAMASLPDVRRGVKTVPPPPLVIAPESRRRSRSEAFRSILEHEFVHINQALRGYYPRVPARPSGRSFFRSFFEITRAEYEANLLQLTRWPRLFPEQHGISLDHWCALRGYSQALEQMIVLVARQNLPPGEVARLLERVPESLEAAFERAGLDAALAPWFRARWIDHLAVALLQVTENHAAIKGAPGFRPIAQWFASHARADSSVS